MILSNYDKYDNTCILSPVCQHFFFLPVMSKQPFSTDRTPPAKCSCRQPGFRLAHPAPVSVSLQLGSGLSSNTSLFVTVKQPDEQHGILQAQNRILPSVLDPSPPVSTPDISTTSLSSEYDTSLPVEADPEIQDKPTGKQKRNTTNAVSYTSQFWC